VVYYHSEALSDKIRINIMDTRKEKLFNLVMENYIANAEPIGSRFLISAGGLKLSEATVRNELRALEEEGFLTHPHTSAGRVPTEKGYHHYIDNLKADNLRISKRDASFISNAAKSDSDYEISRKNLAKSLVELSNETVILAFSLEKIYYTGLSNLFNKPEFKELNLVADISSIFDHCEECLEDFFDKVDEEPKYFIGKEHPFGPILSVLSARFGGNGKSLIALLGPKRMDYKHNFVLLKKVLEII